MSKANYAEIGSRIRMYRKLRGITLDEMATRLYKSRSTVCKYENGKLALTVDVLLEIVEVLDVAVEHLLHSAQDISKNTAAPGSGFFEVGLYYVYFMCDCNDRIFRGVLDILPPKDGRSLAVYYSSVESFDNYLSCQHILHGEMELYHDYAYFIGNNYVNDSEKLLLAVTTPFNTESFARGLICAHSVIFRVPMAFKCIVSKQILPETDKIRNELSINKNDMQTIKKYNALIRNDPW